MDSVVEFRTVAFIPKKSLTNAVPALTHVYTLNAGINEFEKIAPSVRIIYTITQCKRITSAYYPNLSFRDPDSKIVFVSKSLTIGLKVHIRTIHVINRNIWLIDPSQ